jgi:hypothetical protein
MPRTTEADRAAAHEAAATSESALLLAGLSETVPAVMTERDVAVPVVETPAAEAPAPIETPAAPNAAETALASAQAQIAALAGSVDKLVGQLSAQQKAAGEAMPRTPSALEKLANDPETTEDARVVARAILELREQQAEILRGQSAQALAASDAEVEAEEKAFAHKYPGFSAAQVGAIGQAWIKAVDQDESLSVLTFEEFAARHVGGDALHARRAAPTRTPVTPPAPGGKPPAQVTDSTAVGGGRVARGPALDRHATGDDMTNRLAASLAGAR